MKLVADDSVLIATATYNEANNIAELLTRIRQVCGNSVDILVVDDDSPDKTAEIISERQIKDPNLYILRRKYKLGLGSAQKAIVVYSIVNNYKKVVILDADLTHRPEDIPSLLAKSTDGEFVIGSRYIEDGSSSYSGIRNVVSRIGNNVARVAVGTHLRELTTSFRVYSVDTLRRIPINRISSDGYAFFVEIIFLLRERKIELLEIPVRFSERKNDVSKIPRAQILYSGLSLIRLVVRRLMARRTSSAPEWWSTSSCRCCGGNLLILRYEGIEEFTNENLGENHFSCTDVVNESTFPAIYDCLICGLTQIRLEAFSNSLEEYYVNTEDEEYTRMIDVKEKTVRKSLRSIKKYFPKRVNLKVLDVGSYFGIFLEILSRSGYKCYGIEPSKYAVRHSRARSEITVFNGSLDQYMSDGNIEAPFDVITAWDVFEHVENPMKFLLQIEKMLSPGGVFIFSTICIDSTFARFLGRHWPWILPMHVSYFDKKLLSAILSKSGYRILYTGNYVHYARLTYVLEMLIKRLPKNSRSFFSPILKFLPSSLIFPFAFGDVRTFVCEKSRAD